MSWSLIGVRDNDDDAFTYSIFYSYNMLHIKLYGGLQPAALSSLQIF